MSDKETLPKNQIDRKHILIFGLLIFLCISILFFFLYFKSNKEKTELLKDYKLLLDSCVNKKDTSENFRKVSLNKNKAKEDSLQKRIDLTLDTLEVLENKLNDRDDVFVVRY